MYLRESQSEGATARYIKPELLSVRIVNRWRGLDVDKRNEEEEIENLTDLLSATLLNSWPDTLRGTLRKFALAGDEEWRASILLTVREQWVSGPCCLLV